MSPYAPNAPNRAGLNGESPARANRPLGDVLKTNLDSETRRLSSGSEAYGRCFDARRRLRPDYQQAEMTGASMFPDLSRDDVFRLETARLWLRWPRLIDAPAIERFCSLWEVARYTARVPHPYPAGSAERFIYAAREGNAMGRELTLVVTPKKGKRDVIGSISLESRGGERLTLGFALAPEAWG